MLNKLIVAVLACVAINTSFSIVTAIRVIQIEKDVDTENKSILMLNQSRVLSKIEDELSSIKIDLDVTSAENSRHKCEASENNINEIKGDVEYIKRFHSYDSEFSALKTQLDNIWRQLTIFCH